MANLTEGSEWVNGIYRIETADPVQGGEEGIDNIQAKQLGARTRWLRAQLIGLQTNGFTGRRVRRENLFHGALPTFVRNAIMSGPVDGTSGAANFLSFTTGTKNIQINGSPIPIRLSFAAGYDQFGQIDYPGAFTTDFTRNINTDLGMPNNGSEVTIFAEHTPTTDGGTTTISAVRTADVYTTPNPPSATAGVWFNANLQIWLRWNPDFGGGWTTPAFLVPLARLFRNSSGDITSALLAQYRVGIEGAGGVPVGTVIYSAVPHTTPPAGYLHCNGGSLAATAFPNLFIAIGTTFGSAGSGQFNLPDLRGEFIRGADAGRNVDAGRVLGSNQAARVGNHKHELPFHVQASGALRTINPIPFGQGGAFTSTDTNSSVSAASQTHNYTLTNDPFGASNTGGDNRPRNVALNAFIKFI
jgi:microcystin-dependent protein